MPVLRFWQNLLKSKVCFYIQNVFHFILPTLLYFLKYQFGSRSCSCKYDNSTEKMDKLIGKTRNAIPVEQANRTTDRKNSTYLISSKRKNWKIVLVSCECYASFYQKPICFRAECPYSADQLKVSCLFTKICTGLERFRLIKDLRLELKFHSK